MLGAMIGDIVGSIYEFHNIRTKEFEFFSPDCFFTDDSVMTAAVAEALLDTDEEDSEAVIRDRLIDGMKKWGRKYPFAGYGGRFGAWLETEDRRPYRSFGNGSAMRVSPAGWLYDDMFTTRYMAQLTAAVTHNHPEGVKGAEATAAAIFLARNHVPKEQIRTYITQEFGYDLAFTCEEIREIYRFDETCMNTVPQAVVAFLDGTDFEDVIRTGISVGGDSDTLCAIAGSIAEAYYGIPEELAVRVKSFLTEDLLAVADRFYSQVRNRQPDWLKSEKNGDTRK